MVIGGGPKLDEGASCVFWTWREQSLLHPPAWSCARLLARLLADPNSADKLLVDDAVGQDMKEFPVEGPLAHDLVPLLESAVVTKVAV